MTVHGSCFWWLVFVPPILSTKHLAIYFGHFLQTPLHTILRSNNLNTKNIHARGKNLRKNINCDILSVCFPPCLACFKQGLLLGDILILWNQMIYCSHQNDNHTKSIDFWAFYYSIRYCGYFTWKIPKKNSFGHFYSSILNY